MKRKPILDASNRPASIEADIKAEGRFLGRIVESDLTGGWNVFAPDGKLVALVWSRTDARKLLREMASAGEHQ